MPLMQPIVIGPLSELSGSVRVTGQLAGATVTVRSRQRVVAKGIATSGDQRFTLLPSVTLRHTEALFAIQEVGGERSDAPTGDLAMAIAPAPVTNADLGVVSVATHLYACGRYVWIDGAIPGATVELAVGAQLLGSGSADEGIARFG